MLIFHLKSKRLIFFLDYFFFYPGKNFLRNLQLHRYSTIIPYCNATSRLPFGDGLKREQKFQ
jgi:hypothetical protein